MLIVSDEEYNCPVDLRLQDGSVGRRNNPTNTIVNHFAKIMVSTL